MKKLTLDGSYSSDKESLYEYLNKKIQLQENNLDAVYGYFAAITEDMQVTLVNAQKLKENLGNYGGSFIKMLQKAEQRNRHLKVRMVYREAERKFADKKDVRAGNEKKESESGNGRGEKCPYAGKCGGCSGQKKTYEEETHLKQRWVENILGKLTNVDDILTMENPYHYRHKVHAVFSTDRKGRVIAGGYQENTHKVVDIDACRIEEEKAGAIIRTIKEMLPSFKIRPYDEDRGTGVLRHVLIRSGYATGQLLVVLVTGTAVFPARNNFVKELVRRHPEITSVVQNINDKKTSMVLGNRENVLYGRGYIEDELCGRRFRISPKSFYQVNPEQTEKLYQAAIECACLTGEEKVIDAYCGIGTIGIIAAGHAAEVTGVELNRDAVKDARVNAKINGVDNITFYNVDAGKFMVEMAERKKQADVVFMDPPRSGSTEEFLDSVVKLAPEKVVYVSCNPETLERDLVYLMKRQYQIKSCRVIDLFPWTGHVETVVLLSHKKPDGHINVKVEFGEGEGKVPLDNIAKRAESYKPKERVTYKMIKEYIEAKYGFKVHTAYIAEVKRDLGLPMYDAPNAVEELKQPRKHPTAEKVEAIKDALKHFEVI